MVVDRRVLFVVCWLLVVVGRCSLLVGVCVVC